MLSFGEGLAGSLPGGFNPTAGRFSPGAVNTKEAGFEPATVRTLEARVLPAPQLMRGQLREETGGPVNLGKSVPYGQLFQGYPLCGLRSTSSPKCDLKAFD